MRLSLFSLPVLAVAGLAAAQDLPADLQALVEGDLAACTEAGGIPRLTPDYARVADLNGDGRPDYLFDLAGLECENAWSYFCGSAGCPISVWVSGEAGWTNAWSGYAQSAVIEGAAVVAHLHGQFCEPKQPGHVGCEKRIDFSGAAALPDLAAAAAPAATDSAAALPPDATRVLPDLAPGWSLRRGDDAPAAAVAPGPGGVHSFVAFCLDGAPRLSVVLREPSEAPAVLVQFAFEDWTFGAEAASAGHGTGVYTLPLGRDGLAARLAGRDTSVRIGLDRSDQGVLSLAGSSSALREALGACLRL